MTGKTHMAISAATVSVVLAAAQMGSSKGIPFLPSSERGTPQLGAYTMAGLLFIGIVAGLFPDLDAPDTELQHLPGRAANRLARYAKASMPRRSLLAAVVQGLVRLAVLPFALVLVATSAGLRAFTGHRGFTHTLCGMAAFTSLAVGATAVITGSMHWSLTVGTIWLLGYSSHLGADACTPSGIPLFTLPWRLVPATSPGTPAGFNRDTGRGSVQMQANYAAYNRSPRPSVVHLLPKRIRVRTGTMADRVLIRWAA